MSMSKRVRVASIITILSCWTMKVWIYWLSNNHRKRPLQRTNASARIIAGCLCVSVVILCMEINNEIVFDRIPSEALTRTSDWPTTQDSNNNNNNILTSAIIVWEFRFHSLESISLFPPYVCAHSTMKIYFKDTFSPVCRFVHSECTTHSFHFELIDAHRHHSNAKKKMK